MPKPYRFNAVDAYTYNEKVRLKRLKREILLSQRGQVEFGLKLYNLPMGYNAMALRILLKKLGIPVEKIKRTRKIFRYVYLFFRDNQEREEAALKLKNFQWMKRRLKTQICQSQLGLELEQEQVTPEEILKKTSLPNLETPYEHQLQLKQEHISDWLARFSARIVNFNKGLHSWKRILSQHYNGDLCNLLMIRTIGATTGYVTFQRFDIGIERSSMQPVVGLFPAKSVSNKVDVAPIDGLVNLPNNMIQLVEIFQSFIRNLEYMTVYDRITKKGNFYQLILCLNENTNYFMMNVILHLDELEDSVLNRFKEDLVETFSNTCYSGFAVTSIYLDYFKDSIHVRHGDEPELVDGDEHFEINLNGLSYYVTPSIALRNSTRALEQLNIAIVELMGLDQTYTLLDLRCGIGTLALYAARYCKEIIAFECDPDTYDIAVCNAKLNHIDNVKFVDGSLGTYLKEVTCTGRSKYIAVVDCFQEHFTKRMADLLSNNMRIEKVVFVSSALSLKTHNLFELCSRVPTNPNGERFMPTKAVAVDSGPHTKSYEVVILFERMVFVNRYSFE